MGGNNMDYLTAIHALDHMLLAEMPEYQPRAWKQGWPIPANGMLCTTRVLLTSTVSEIYIPGAFIPLRQRLSSSAACSFPEFRRLSLVGFWMLQPEEGSDPGFDRGDALKRHGGRYWGRVL